MAFLISPRAAQFDALKVDLQARVPSIWSASWEPMTEAVCYLAARARGTWSSSGQRSEYAHKSPLANASTLAAARDLTNFFDWCENADTDWHVLNYSELVSGYQRAMEDGAWNQTRAGQPLAPATINRRMVYVCDFLVYAAVNGKRAPFEVGRRLARSPRDKYRMGHGRVGKVRQHPSELTIPQRDALAEWLGALRAAHGPAPALMAKTTLATGLRADELVRLRSDQIPKPSSGRETATMTILHGTKGGRRRDDPDMRGNARRIAVPSTLLTELHAYRREARRHTVARFRRTHPEKRAPRELFLSERTMRGYSYARWYQLWRSVPLPCPGFSPHIGRHVWACYTLADKMREEMQIAAGKADYDGPAHVGACLSLIDLYIRPQLGHVSDRTSMQYLHWVVDLFDEGRTMAGWWDDLNAEL